jgi:hypothetical protein
LIICLADTVLASAAFGQNAGADGTFRLKLNGATQQLPGPPLPAKNDDLEPRGKQF